ncbi:exonuclease III [Cordyceps militaris CM01]|uniref:Exonuclease III n=1 Tax=Cordyceps militaris (strain CM01) TaxID=983644 RepID=G3JT96_CORMM|nr:exonuclease III [Cordyceps militaris CM01]EGX88243.1 exonuclease III [Cordyceps militaris CM01]
MFLSKWLAAAAVAVTMVPAAAVAATGDPIQIYVPPKHVPEVPPMPTPVLTWRFREKETTFAYYNISQSHDKNWIGIWYAYAGEPVNGTKMSSPLLWTYAPGKNGKVVIPTKSLPERPFRAFMMAADSYWPVADPVDFNTASWRDVRWLAQEVRLPVAREGEFWTHDAGKMTSAAGDAGNRYTIMYCTGDGWVRTTPDGILYGTPTRHSRRDTHLALKVETPRHVNVHMELKVDVRKPTAPLLTKLRVVTLNTWDGGTNVANYHAKQLSILAKVNADIISLQETLGIHGLRLAYALGYHAHQTADAAILSRYPIVEALNATAHSVGVRIALDGDRQQVVVWNAHFPSDQYGPYSFCFDGKNDSAVIADEVATGRAGEAAALAAIVKPYARRSDTVPVLVMGGFGSPSHLDYTAGTTDLHCGAGEVRWPTSWALTQAGLRDAYRVARPDPIGDTGVTWSPIVPTNAERARREPQDRIDFVYFAGGKSLLRVGDAKTWTYWGKRPLPAPNHARNDWTSDHMGVEAWFYLDLPPGGVVNETALQEQDEAERAGHLPGNGTEGAEVPPLVDEDDW